MDKAREGLEIEKMKLVHFRDATGINPPQFELLVSEETGQPVEVAEMLNELRMGGAVEIRQLTNQEFARIAAVTKVCALIDQLDQALEQAFKGHREEEEVAAGALAAAITSIPVWNSFKTPGAYLDAAHVPAHI